MTLSLNMFYVIQLKFLSWMILSILEKESFLSLAELLRITLLRSVHHDSDKKILFCCCYYAHYAMIMTRKNKLFFIPTLLSLCNYHEDKILFCHCYYVHHAMITIRNKLIFIPTLLSLLNCHEKNTAVLFPSGSPVFLKDSCMIQ